ncbi:hypothetical protein [Breoghania sp. L-A4]|uniref:hypothetical protein n=1 Tax=Breoghania sp. L-A4 TaxID=2304600 RepID=UPI000E359879|nr:hypothetical protein [Breoghania sp. L-A4]AXS42474.1 hypothetical protein D1F64_06035 [Breoghania sp. L-A4]
MSETEKPETGGKRSAKERREQRLAEALRANLRRRKAQTRERRNQDREAGPSGSGGETQEP